jgi:hypothetical protein
MSHCWHYDGVIHHGGYGVVWDTQKKQRVQAHRFFYEKLIGEIPNELFGLHKCDVKDCVNPKHLFVGTMKDNIQDAAKKGRLIDRRGENAPWAKLTQKQVNEIRERYISKKITLTQLANEYGVTVSHIWKIVNNQRWVV